MKVVLINLRVKLKNQVINNLLKIKRVIHFETIVLTNRTQIVEQIKY